jgi:hypothetical protein
MFSSIEKENFKLFAYEMWLIGLRYTGTWAGKAEMVIFCL